MDFINILVIGLSVITLSNGISKSYTNKYLPTNAMTTSTKRVPTSTMSPILWCPVGPPITKFGELKTLDNGCICTAFESAVCGTDGSSYFNRCILDCVAKKKPCFKLKCNDECSLCAPVVPLVRKNINPFAIQTVLHIIIHAFLMLYQNNSNVYESIATHRVSFVIYVNHANALTQRKQSVVLTVFLIPINVS